MARKHIQAFFNKLEQEIEQWDAIQRKASAIFGSVSVVGSRLDILAKPQSLGALDYFCDARELLQAKQFERLGDLLTGLRRALDMFSSCVAEMEAGRAALWREIRKEKVSPSDAMQRGATELSIAQLLDSIESICDMYKTELASKYVLVDMIATEISAIEGSNLEREKEADLDRLYQQWVVEQAIDHAQVQEMLSIIRESNTFGAAMR